MTIKQINIWQKKSRRCILLLLLISMFVVPSMAQNNYRFSQYMHNELSVNPAYAGTSNALLGNLIYRNQWMGIDGQPTTQILSLQSPIANKKVGLGLLIFNESIGIQKDLGVYLNYAYHLRFRRSRLSLGLRAGITNKTINWNDISTGSQNQNGIADPIFPVEKQTFMVPNFGFGAYYYAEQFYIGLSIPRILANELPLTNEMSDLFTVSGAQIHTYVTAGYVFHLKNEAAIKPSLMFKQVSNAPSQLSILLNVYFANELNFGLGVHLKDSYIFMLGYGLTESLKLSYSYDFTTSDLAFYSPTTHEFVLSYIIPSKNDWVLSPRYF